MISDHGPLSMRVILRCQIDSPASPGRSRVRVMPSTSCVGAAPTSPVATFLGLVEASDAATVGPADGVPTPHAAAVAPHAATVAVVIFDHGLFCSPRSRVDRVADPPWRPSQEDGARSLSFVPPSPSLKSARKVGLVVTVSKYSAARFLSEAMLSQSASVAC